MPFDSDDVYTDEAIDRTKRVKEARDEAKKEIDSYKKNKDDEFKKFESEVDIHHHPTLRLRSYRPPTNA